MKLNVKPFQETLNAGRCGPASLKIVLDFYGINKSEDELAVLTHTTAQLGTSAENMLEAAETLGLVGELHLNATLTDVDNWLLKGVPVIVDWFTRGRDDYPEDMASADGHYSVVSGLDEEHIYLQDPEIGRERKMRREVFERAWFDFTGEFIRPDELLIRQLIAIYPRA